jgi:signal peptidase I
MYFINPFGTASDDPRARITGYMPYIIPSVSMIPTLKRGDHIVVSTFSYMNEKPKINDLIVFKYPKNRDVNYIMRIVALSGDKIALIKGKVVVNENEIDQSYLDLKNSIRTSQETIGPWHVPLDMVFVLGDNRDNSNDSRYWGFVPTKDIVGEVTMILN